MLIFNPTSFHFPFSNFLSAVAKLLADEMTANGQIIGIGTGITVNEYLREISERLGDGRLSVSLNYNFQLNYDGRSVALLFVLF